jgi:hypothetical protein
MDASIQYIGTRDPCSTAAINERKRKLGVIDLTNERKRRPEYSTKNGKRARHTPQETRNLSEFASIDVTKWEEGAFKWVHKGHYKPNPTIPGDDGGPQNGEHCVHKEFKTGSVYESSCFDTDLITVSKAREVIDAFNAGKCCSSKEILLNQPAVWQEFIPDSEGKHKKYLVEPMLEGEFLKFNSNSGYTNGADVMQALSHFSYHHSGRRHLLCDLQGGHYNDAYILTDPVVMSSDNSKKYGPTDLGSEGIDNFFARHRCGLFCRSQWRTPRCPLISEKITCTTGSSMSLTIGTVKSEAARRTRLAAAIIASRR